MLVVYPERVKLPEIDDELAKKCGPFKNLTELKADIEKNLKTQTEHREEEWFQPCEHPLQQ